MSFVCLQRFTHFFAFYNLCRKTEKCVNPDVYALFRFLKTLILKAPGRTRTGDPRITNALRYQLRYGSMHSPLLLIRLPLHKNALDDVQSIP